MKKARRTTVHDRVLGFHWHLQVGGTEESALRWLCRIYKLPMPPSETFGHNYGSFSCNDSMPYTSLIWIEHDSGSNTMAHEVAHAVNHVCRVLKLDPREADEFSASYTGYLFQQLNKLVHRKS